MLTSPVVTQETWRVQLIESMPIPEKLHAACRQQGVVLTVTDVFSEQSCDALVVRTETVWFDALTQIRAWVAVHDSPVIVWMREASTALRVAAYDQGAADVLVPEIEPAEFAVRVRAAIARAKRQMAPESVELAARDGVLQVVLRHRSVVGSGGPIQLTGVQWRILRHFILNRGVSQSHAEIVAAVWGIGDDAAARHALRTHISALRRQLQLDHKTLVTVHGYGYRLQR